MHIRSGGMPHVLNKDRLCESVGEGATVTKQKKLQSLWGGYGWVSEVYVKGYGSAILKEIRAPIIGDSDVGHLRKCASYAVEVAFYRKVAPFLRRKGVAVPSALDIEEHIEEGSCQVELLLTDLRVGYPRTISRRGSEKDVLAVLDMLARFHACYFESVVPEGLWIHGTYWHLDTRKEEWARMGDKTLQAAARALSSRLQTKKHRTLIHGDAKAENLCIGNDAACYDFQYTGYGLGAQDLAYFLVSSCDDKLLETKEESLLDFYHLALSKSLPHGKSHRRDDIQREFDIAVADFMRFYDGWASGRCGYMWGLKRKEKVIKQLTQNGVPENEEGWIEAVFSEYPTSCGSDNII